MYLYFLVSLLCSFNTQVSELSFEILNSNKSSHKKTKVLGRQNKDQAEDFFVFNITTIRKITTKMQTNKLNLNNFIGTLPF